MGIFISVPKTIECVLTALILAALSCGVIYRQVGVLQSSGYGSKKYFRWLKKKGNLAYLRHTFLSALCLLSYAMCALAFSFTGEWSAVIALSAYLLF